MPGRLKSSRTASGLKDSSSVNASSAVAAVLAAKPLLERKLAMFFARAG
jgi:hypothetical protein